MGHAVLLGDSIFANAAYAAGGPDVRSQLQAQLTPDRRVMLLAADGDCMQEDALAQLHWKVREDRSRWPSRQSGHQTLDRAPSEAIYLR